MATIPWTIVLICEGPVGVGQLESLFLSGQPMADDFCHEAPAGLHNPHTMCYLNASVKLLLSCPRIAIDLLQGGSPGAGALLIALTDVMDT